MLTEVFRAEISKNKFLRKPEQRCFGTFFVRGGCDGFAGAGSGTLKYPPGGSGRPGRLRGIAQSGSAPALGAGCRGFESLYPDHSRPLQSRFAGLPCTIPAERP